MNWHAASTLITLLITFFICGLLVLFVRYDHHPSSLSTSGNVPVKQGQVWVYDACGKDPFMDPCPVRNEVIAVQNGYVKYRNQYGETDSCPVEWFLVDSELVIK